MQNFPGVPLVGMGSQRLRLEGVRRCHDDNSHCLAPHYGYTNCTPRTTNYAPRTSNCTPRTVNCTLCIPDRTPRIPDCTSCYSICTPCVSHIRTPQVCSVSQDWRRCFACKTMDILQGTERMVVVKVHSPVCQARNFRSQRNGVSVITHK